MAERIWSRRGATVNLHDLIDSIAAFQSTNVFNPWRDNDPLDYPLLGALARRDRLFDHFDCADPRLLLIGEAPGYQGCHFSGIAFTNESLLMRNMVPRVSRLGANNRITMRLKPWSEPSATIVWGELHRLGIATTTIMWNAFAWHPHKPGEPMSNRAPTRVEVENGWNVLRAVLTYFVADRGARVIAVGNIAADALKRLDVQAVEKVRHPSMGGARKFRAGIERLAA
jgi:uracil-DNA glycosylase